LTTTIHSSLVLKYYLLLRCLTVLGLGVGIAIISAYFGLRPPLLPCLAIVAVLAAATWLTALRRSGDVIRQRSDLLWNLLIDIAALFMFTYFTGGSTNPFIILFALPVIFAAATLPLTASAVVALATIGAYTITMFVASPLDPGRMQIKVSDEYLWGNWYAFVLIVAGITALVARLARSIQQRDQALASARQDALHSERAIALGMLATRAAEDLGTPLATIAVLARDLENEATNSDTRQRLETLNEAVNSCREILSDLAADAGQSKSANGRAMRADHYLAELMTKWGARNPTLRPKLLQDGPQPAPQIIADSVLDQAVLTLLDNAVDIAHSSEAVVAGKRTNPSAVRNRPEDQIGMGTGLFLAIATLKRMGAEVNFNSSRAADNALELSIPMAAIAIRIS
jgi:two-component system, sensor histidine kinase RegB